MGGLIASSCCENGFSGGYSPGAVRPWSVHLRGPGCLRRDILLFTDVADPGIVGTPTASLPREPRPASELQLGRIPGHAAVPAHRYDSTVQIS